MSHGIYLECDKCGATLGGEQVTKNPEPPVSRLRPDILRSRARALGWKCSSTSNPPVLLDRGYDLCPECH